MVRARIFHGHPDLVITVGRFRFRLVLGVFRLGLEHHRLENHSHGALSLGLVMCNWMVRRPGIALR